MVLQKKIVRRILILYLVAGELRGKQTLLVTVLRVVSVHNNYSKLY